MAALNIEDNGGYDGHWVEDPPDELKCLVCLLVARDAQQHGDDDGCGKVFCQTCINNWQRENDTCPNCRKHLTTFKDVRSARHIKALKLKCNNISNGCQWVNTLGSLEDHFQTCGYTPLLCPNQCKTGNEEVQILKKDLDDHLGNKCPRRQFPCQHCNESGEYEERMTTHLETCEKVKVKCPNDKCKSSIPRCEVSTHRSTCLYEAVSCKYSVVGCGETPLRKDLNTHEEDHQFHLRITTDTVLKQSKKMAGLEDKISSSEREKAVGRDTIAGLEDTIAGLVDKIRYSEKRMIVEKNVIASLENKLACLERKLTKTSLTPFKFKVSNYLEKKRNDRKYYSPPFHASVNGYKMCVRVDPNGNGAGKGSYVSVYAHLMKGDNDGSLSWPFTGKVTYQLLNQLEDKNHHTGQSTSFTGASRDVSRRVVDGERSGKGYGQEKYISHTKLDYDIDNNCQYLKDNTLIFRVTVKIPNHKPWLECTVCHLK